jgi:hypothetical protein
MYILFVSKIHILYNRIAKYNNPTIEEVVARLHWTNTQPMWREENASKGNRFIS